MQFEKLLSEIIGKPCSFLDVNGKKVLIGTQALSVMGVIDMPSNTLYSINENGEPVFTENVYTMVHLKNAEIINSLLNKPFPHFSLKDEDIQYIELL